MKMYIVGSVASGKSTLARRISARTGIPCCHLDEVMYEPDATDSWGNRKRPLEQREALFSEILAQDDYIMEDAGRECFVEGMQQADVILRLEIPLRVRKKRIIFRWLKQNLGVEPCIYRPRVAMLRAMFQWAKNYDSGADGTKDRIALFTTKTVILHNNRQINSFLNENFPNIKR